MQSNGFAVWEKMLFSSVWSQILNSIMAKNYLTALKLKIGNILFESVILAFRNFGVS